MVKGIGFFKGLFVFVGSSCVVRVLYLGSIFVIFTEGGYND